MQNIFVPNHFSLLLSSSDDIEILEITSPNGSGECKHTFLLHISDKISSSFEKSFLQEIEMCIKSSHISIRECIGGIQTVTSLNFLDGKLGEMFYSSIDVYNKSDKIYYTFFLKALLYMINYYYFIRNEKDIRIQRDGFQTLFKKNAESYKMFESTFKLMEKALEKIGFLNYLFTYDKNFDQYVLQESVFLLLSDKQTVINNNDYKPLQVYFLLIII